MEEKREKSIFRLLPRNSNFTWFLVTFALNVSFYSILVSGQFILMVAKHFSENVPSVV